MRNTSRRQFFKLGILGTMGLTFFNGLFAEKTSVIELRRIALKSGQSFNVPVLSDGEFLLIEPSGYWENSPARLIFSQRLFRGENTLILDKSFPFLLSYDHHAGWRVKKIDG